jgi:hypothetical protein
VRIHPNAPSVAKIDLDQSNPGACQGPRPPVILGQKLWIFPLVSTTASCTGAKHGASRSAVRACRRQVNTTLAATPLRRATSVTFAPGRQRLLDDPPHMPRQRERPVAHVVRIRPEAVPAALLVRHLRRMATNCRLRNSSIASTTRSRAPLALQRSLQRWVRFTILCIDLDQLIEFAGECRVPVRALTLIERACADLQAYLDDMQLEGK